MTLKDYCIDKRWSLFLDRDGVINERIIDGYVRHWDEFQFLPGVKQSLARLSDIFGPIFIVTNQQGIGKGIMTREDLQEIHRRMVSEIEAAGGRISRVYHSPHLAGTNHNFRKPNTGMALQARKDFSNVDLSRSVMVGDSVSDMEFGRNAGMVNVYIGDPGDVQDIELAFCCHSLIEFTDEITAK